MGSKETKALQEALGKKIVAEGFESPNFHADCAENGRLLAQYQTEVKAENADALAIAKSKLGAGIKSLIANLKLAQLSGEYIAGVLYKEAIVVDGQEVEPMRMLLNPVAPTKRKVSVKTGNGGNGDRRDLIATFNANATADEKIDMARLEASFVAAVPEAKHKVSSAQWQLKAKVAKRVEDAALAASK